MAQGELPFGRDIRREREAWWQRWWFDEKERGLMIGREREKLGSDGERERGWGSSNCVKRDLRQIKLLFCFGIVLQYHHTFMMVL